MYAGIDLSTTTARCLILDSNYRPTGFGSHSHAALGSGLTQSADRWISSTRLAFSTAVQQAGVAPSKISSIGIATQGVSAVQTDESGSAATGAVGWIGPNGNASIVTAEEADYWYEASGRRISQPFLAWRLLSETNTQPASRWALAGDLIAFHLTGHWRIDPCLASTTALIDQCNRDWSDPLLTQVGIGRPQLSEIGPAAGAAGPAHGPLARQLGLSPAAIVALPTQDQRAAVLIADPDESSCTLTFGTAGAIVSAATGCRSRLTSHIPLTPGLRSDLWWHEGVVLSAGVVLDWAANLLGLEGAAEVLDLAAQTSKIPPHLQFRPHLAGSGSPDWQSDASGALEGLGLATSRGDIARAIAEGLCQEYARNVGLLSHPDQEIRLIGRAGSHPAISKTLSQMLHRPVTVVQFEEPTALGAALIGAQAREQLDSVADVIARLVTKVEVSP